MIETISNMVLEYLIRNKVVKNDRLSRDFYRYGIEITVSSFLNIFIILLLSVICNKLISGIVFLIVFIPLRQFTGGYHAKTYFKCNLTFAICFIVTLYVSKIVHIIPMTYQMLIAFLELFFIFLKCPIKNENKIIRDYKQYVRCKYLSCCLFIGYWVFGFFVLTVFEFGILIHNTLHLVVILGIIAIAKERSLKKYEKETC